MKKEEQQNGNCPIQDLGATTRFLANILDKMSRMVEHLDTQINILIGIGSAIFVFSVSRLEADGAVPVFLILGVSAAISALVSLFAIHPPKFMRKKGQSESLMYNKKIADFPLPEDYERELSCVVGYQGLIVKQYATEIYNISKYYYRPKRELFKIARSILLAGILVSFLIFLFGGIS